MRLTVMIALVAIAFTSCSGGGERVEGNGKIATETRNIEKAAQIKVLGAIDVFVSQGPTSVKVEGDENILKYILTESNDGWLEIKTKDNTDVNPTQEIKVYVTTPNMNGVQIGGSGDLMATGRFSTDGNMTFKIMGSGNVNIDVNAPAVDAEIKGSGSLTISGETREVGVNIAGSGKFNGTNLKSENAKVNIAGSGDAYLFAESKLHVSIAGSGGVRYKGNAEVNKNIAGSGTVEKVD